MDFLARLSGLLKKFCFFRAVGLATKWREKHKDFLYPLPQPVHSLPMIYIPLYTVPSLQLMNWHWHSNCHPESTVYLRVHPQSCTFCWFRQMYNNKRSSLVAQTVKNLPAMQETWVWSLGQKDPLKKGMATYSSILAWRIPWTEEPGGLQSMGLQRVGHDQATNTHTHTHPPQHISTIMISYRIFLLP